MEERTELEALNTALYEKMWDEQVAFHNRLLSMSPVDVLDHAYEYLAREDFLLSREYNDLSEKQCRALLNTPDLLEKLCKEYDRYPQSRMEEIEAVTESFANALLREEFIKNRRREAQNNE